MIDEMFARFGSMSYIYGASRFSSKIHYIKKLKKWGNSSRATSKSTFKSKQVKEQEGEKNSLL